MVWRWVVGLIVVLAVVWGAVGLYETRKMLPAGVSVAGREFLVPAGSVRFLVDRTYVDEDGVRHSEQQIFDEVMSMIERAERYILVDMFLYNSWQGKSPEETRGLADELTRALVAKKQVTPDIVITVISDPLNMVYGGAVSPHFEELKENGIEVVVTDLTKLRDSNPLYSVVWHMLVRRLGNSPDGGVMPHPFQAGGEGVTVRSWLALLNFKANHRKLVVADEVTGRGSRKMVSLVTSANPHDGSSAHSNVAVQVKDSLWQDVVASEQAVGTWSGVTVAGLADEVDDEQGEVKVQLLTEGAIRKKVVELVERAQVGDAIDMAMFYLSERSVINSLVRASQRGAAVRLVLDPNKDAFGYTKNGVPNRPVAGELIKRTEGDIEVRWCNTHGEQCHTKLVLLKVDGRYTMILGSANLTRRNVADYNLETNVLVSAGEKIAAIAAAGEYVDEIWTNRDGKIFTVDYGVFEGDSWYKRVVYLMQETTGLSSF